MDVDLAITRLDADLCHAALNKTLFQATVLSTWQ